MNTKLYTPLLVLALLVGACTTGNGARDTGTSQQRTPADSPPAPTASPSPEFVVGPAIEPRIIFKGKVSVDDKKYVTATIERAFKYFKVPHPPGEPVERFAEVYGEESPYASEGQYCGRLTDAGGIQIFLYACSGFGRTFLTSTIVHEVFHALQAFTMDTYRIGPDVFVDGLIPRWFDEGSAEWASAKVLDEWDLESYTEARDYNVFAASGAIASLKELEKASVWFERDEEQESRQYALSFLAVERAVGGRGWRAALDVYQATMSHQVPRWDQSFAKTFGITMKRFYERFATSRASGFPPP